ncbi:MAG: phosphate ABC transporter permease PstA [Rhizobiaceae bacterium]|nr:phosphate ABC transporter permease PstA [Rhizobiaceae bacterium]
MTDSPNIASAALGIEAGSERRKQLVRGRYRSESRFKYMGLGAVLLSVGFLVLLLSTVVGNGLPAFTYHYAKLPVDLSSVERAEVENADYSTIVRDGISQAMPYLEGRNGRRLARSMITGAANIELRNEVIGDPGLVGAKREIGVPVSDFTDLYLKGLTARSNESKPETALTLSGTEDTVELSTGLPVFNSFLDLIKEVIERDVQRVEVRLSGYRTRLEQQQDIIANSTNEARVEEAKQISTAIQGEISSLEQQIERLNTRNTAGDELQTLNSAMPSLLLKVNGGTIKVTEVSGARAKGEVILPVSAPQAAAGDWTMQVIPTAEENRKFSDKEVAVTDRLVDDGLIENRWNTIFFTKGASREPEMAGVWGAVVGSFFTMIVTLMLSFPLGVAAAVYLEEFAPKNRLTSIIEVNINNLAAVPSIVFGLLGLAVFLNFFNLPRSAPVVGGMVLALMTLPTIIIASRAALKAVPPSIREAALGVGASRLQAVFHHVLPLAMPGMLTGTIIGMAQALGETAPLLMIGMVAFVVDIPAALTDPATVLPVQIYMWADFPEPGFQQKTAAAIMVLLGFLVLMNALAVLLRKRFERRW